MKHDARGWWLGDLEPADPRPPLTGAVSADVAVIGGGYTGMWAAWLVRELEPQARVVLLDTDLCGHGPSGRNGGFVNSLWFSLPTLIERYGDEPALTVADAAQEAIDAVGTWCDDQAVDAWYRKGGYLQVSTTPRHDGAWVEAVTECARLGRREQGSALTAAEVAGRCASPIFRDGAFYPGSATVNPALLAMGLRERLIDAGVEIHERTRASELHAYGDCAVIRTDGGGEVRAGHVILAGGGALGRLRPLRRRLTVTSSHMVMTEPVPDVIEELGWGGGECITDSRHMLHYFRTTPDGRIAFGWGGGQVIAGARLNGHAEVDAGLAAQVSRALVRFFPQLEGRRIEHAWGGPIDVSPSHLPTIANLTGRIHAGFGYTGNGVGPSRMVARALASLALERDDAHARLAIVDPPPLYVPPEPLRFAGGVVIRSALLRRELAEESGRRPDPLTRAISSLPELVGVQIGR